MSNLDTVLDALVGNSGWIDSLKQLPASNESVLLWYGDEHKIGWFVACGSRQDSYWLFDSCSHRVDECSHWMPLPHPPGET